MVSGTAAKRRRHLLLGLIVVIAFVASAVVAVTSQHGLPWASRTVVQAAFDEVGSLRAGDDVRIANIRVGYVGGVRYEKGQAIAELRFDGRRPIYRDARAVAASVGARSALGQKYVDFAPGGPGAGLLGPDEVIPPKQTVGAQELSDVLDVLDDPTRAALGSTVRELGHGTAGHAQDVRDTLATMPAMLPDLGEVADALSAHNGADITSMLHAVDGLAGRFEGRQQQIGELVGRLDRTLAGVAVDGTQPLTDTLNKAPETLRAVDGALRKLDPPLADTETAMRAAGPGAEALGAATPDLRGVLREGQRPLAKVPGVAGDAQPAVDRLTATFRDAKPLAPKVTEALRTARKPLEVLAPYSAEASMLFTHGANALSQGDAAGNWLRIYLLFSTESVSGVLPGVKDPITTRDAYPAPGQAAKDTRQSPIGGGR